jgi:hypothetical protein
MGSEYCDEFTDYGGWAEVTEIFEGAAAVSERSKLGDG